MTYKYDMSVDHDTLCEIESGLDEIYNHLNDSTAQMQNALLESQDFLEGNQFEKAKRKTKDCVEVIQKAGNNVLYAKKYICELKACLEDYSKCTYNEG